MVSVNVGQFVTEEQKGRKDKTLFYGVDEKNNTR